MKSIVSFLKSVALMGVLGMSFVQPLQAAPAVPILVQAGVSLAVSLIASGGRHAEVRVGVPVGGPSPAPPVNHAPITAPAPPPSSSSSGAPSSGNQQEDASTLQAGGLPAGSGGVGCSSGAGNEALASSPQSFPIEMLTHCISQWDCHSFINLGRSGAPGWDQRAIEAALDSGAYQCQVDPAQPQPQLQPLSSSQFEFGPASRHQVLTTQLLCERTPIALALPPFLSFPQERELPREAPPHLAASPFQESLAQHLDRSGSYRDQAIFNPLPWESSHSTHQPPSLPQTVNIPQGKSDMDRLAPRDQVSQEPHPEENQPSWEQQHQEAIGQARNLKTLFPEESQAISEGLESWNPTPEAGFLERSRVYQSLEGYQAVQEALLAKESDDQNSSTRQSRTVREERRWIVEEAAHLGLQALSQAVQEIREWTESDRISELLETNDGFLALAQDALDVGISLTPLATGKDIYEALTGKNLVTGKVLNPEERSSAVAGALSGGITRAGAKLKKAVQLFSHLKDALQGKRKSQADFLTAGFRKALLHGEKQAKRDHSIKQVEKPWKINRPDKVVLHSDPRIGRIERDPNTERWWSKDKARHGGSYWKVFQETARGLEWLGDADQEGKLLKGKHKSKFGTHIPWKQLRTIKSD